jgi:hypothetical protein
LRGGADARCEQIDDEGQAQDRALVDGDVARPGANRFALAHRARAAAEVFDLAHDQIDVLAEQRER